MQKSIKFKSLQAVSEYAKENKKTLLICDNEVLDATTFLDHHPGGPGLVGGYAGKDITQEMDEHHPLSRSVAQSMAIGSLDKEIKKIIDPEKGLVPQIWKMDHTTYLNNVHKPNWVFTKCPRMFDSNFLESFSYCSWYNIVYVPFLFLFVYFKRYVQDHWQQTNISTLLLAFLSGIFLFSFIQYVLHRFLFHSEKRILDSRIMRCTHFILHGIHHMFPFDPYRLVLPPIFTAVVLTIGYFTLYQLLYWTNPVADLMFWTGFLTGYIMYDWTHYAIHHIDTSKNKKSFFRIIQKHHNQHHYGDEDAGYGVSTPFWDHIFRTLFHKKKHE